MSLLIHQTFAVKKNGCHVFLRMHLLYRSVFQVGLNKIWLLMFHLRERVVELFHSLDSGFKLHTPAQPASKGSFGDKASDYVRNDQQNHNMSSKGDQNHSFSHDQQRYNMSKGQHNDLFQQAHVALLNEGHQNESFQQVQQSVSQSTMSHKRQSDENLDLTDDYRSGYQNGR
ncbi:uncharacterized protein LOC133469293 isoform X1 [Phyllopteryx taeniolatus]|uniref:uncharacterized protein LOC133469293 isoform X1 n=1 Tax=Phyllopteryx taeniolatus TaxID=161469 RepID=UPI002AD53DA2|nr:uncharacterized protein LOC133469293 isoform X1 [Phyllopteryx taeniolatus]